jgi:alkanesulfonate monooxygenase SsuD/methylene tetrahydromethanopterin reductase-like flavin-dependent oxidoreductase (luciferase family)
MIETPNLAPLFGAAIDPSAADPQEPFRRARIADENGLDLITLMDHPYNMKLFDTWTLMTALAMSTKRIHVGANVLSLPLRPPAMLAKMAASLDVLTGGRVELGLGAGAYWDGIAAFGGPRRAPGEAYDAFKDALHILRGMWDNAGKSFTYEGDTYQVTGARPGPAPAHPIRIWVGAGGPRMLRLLGRMADGLLISYNYSNPERLLGLSQRIDEGAQQAGRDPTGIRRGYNLMGVLNIGREDTTVPGLKEDNVYGSVKDWTDKIVQWRQEYRQDTFIFWPVAGNQRVQIEAFAQEVVPAVREALA